MFRIIATAFTFIMLWATAVVAEEHEKCSAEGYSKEGNRRLNRIADHYAYGEREIAVRKALEIVEDAENFCPKSVRHAHSYLWGIYSEWGKGYFDQGRSGYSLAVDHLLHVINYDLGAGENTDELKLYLGDLYFRDQNLMEARAQADDVLTGTGPLPIPLKSNAHFLRGLALIGTGDLEEAVEDFDQVAFSQTTVFDGERALTASKAAYSTFNRESLQLFLHRALDSEVGADLNPAQRQTLDKDLQLLGDVSIASTVWIATDWADLKQRIAKLRGINELDCTQMNLDQFSVRISSWKLLGAHFVADDYVTGLKEIVDLMTESEALCPQTLYDLAEIAIYFYTVNGSKHEAHIIDPLTDVITSNLFLPDEYEGVKQDLVERIEDVRFSGTRDILTRRPIRFRENECQGFFGNQRAYGMYKVEYFLDEDGTPTDISVLSEANDCIRSKIFREISKWQYTAGNRSDRNEARRLMRIDFQPPG